MGYGAKVDHRQAIYKSALNCIKSLQKRIGGQYELESTCYQQAFMDLGHVWKLYKSYTSVIPAQAGIQILRENGEGLDSRLRGNDNTAGFPDVL
jgi:hypothetical protein